MVSYLAHGTRRSEGSRGVHPNKRRICSRNVAVDDLDHEQVPVVGHDVEGLGLHIGVLVSLPALLVLGQDGVRSLGGLLGDRLDGLGAIDGLLRADGRRETARHRFGSVTMIIPPLS